MNLRYRDRLFRDEEGDDLPDRGALQAHVVETARELIFHGRMETIRSWWECSLEVTDEAGEPVLSLPFTDVGTDP